MDGDGEEEWKPLINIHGSIRMMTVLFNRVPRPVFEPEFRTVSREIYRETIATRTNIIISS